MDSTFCRDISCLVQDMVISLPTDIKQDLSVNATNVISRSTHSLVLELLVASHGPSHQQSDF